MGGFKTVNGQYKCLVICVISYRPLVWNYLFYDKVEEGEAWITKGKIDWPGEWNAVYHFNKEGPLKEQATYAVGSAFSRVLQNIIDTDLVNRTW